MGCWNGTCILSGLAIRASEEAVAIPVIQTQKGDLGTLFPIFGEYSDYGSLNSIKEDISTSLLVNTVNKKILEGVPERKPSYTEEEHARCIELSKKARKDLTEEESDELPRLHLKIMGSQFETYEAIRISDLRDAKLKDECDVFKSTEDLLDALERGGLRSVVDLELNTFGVGSTWNTLTITLIHGEVWKALKQNILTDPGMFTIYGYELSEELKLKYSIRKKGYRDATGEEIFQLEMDKIKEQLGSVTAMDLFDIVCLLGAKKHGKKWEDASEEDMTEWLQGYNQFIKENKGTVGRRGMAYKINDLTFLSEEDRSEIDTKAINTSHLIGVLKDSILRDHEYIHYETIFLKEIAESITLNGLDTWEDSLRNLFVLRQAVSALRKNFTIMSGAGSQADEHTTVAAMAKAVIEVSAKRAAPDDEDDE